MRLSRQLTDTQRQIVAFQIEADMLSFQQVCWNSLSAYAIDGVVAIRYSKRVLLDVARSTPRLMELYVEHTQRELQSARNHLTLLATRSPDQKLLGFLLHWRERSLSHEIVLPMKRTEIANFLGLSAETVSRTLRKLERNQMISIDRNRVEISDAERITAMICPIKLATSANVGRQKTSLSADYRFAKGVVAWQGIWPLASIFVT